MSYMFKTLLTIVLTSTLSTIAAAQGLVTQRNLSLAMAKTIAEAALASCKAQGYNTAVAVVDRAGQVMVILRDEQASAQQADMARRKAYTARMFRTSTLEFQKRTSVGSSGSSQEKDDACAKAGVAAVAALLK